jgi:undecaprenyl-phosphate galactose phosphotransferase/putative colanic acid biosynthesis UDP-glucose lipid carrier transferase
MRSVLPAAKIWSQAPARPSVFQYVPYHRVGIFTAFTDFSLILAASVLAGVLYNAIVFDTEGQLTAYIAVGCYSGLIFTLLARVFDLYLPNTLLSVSAQIRGVLIAWGAVLLFVTSMFFLFKSGANYSRGATIGFSLAGLGFILASRFVTGFNLRRALADGTVAGRRVIVIGDPEELNAKTALHLLRTYGTREVGRFELSPASNPPHSTAGQDLAVIDAGIAAAQTGRVEQVLLAMGWADQERRDLICERLRVLPIPVFLLPDRPLNSVFAATDRFNRAPTAIEIQRAPLSTVNIVVKRGFDLIFAAVGLVLLVPLLLITSLAIKLDSAGPILFRQRRKGFNGREFAIYKFRTMNVLEDGPCIRQARRDDQRVTRVGRILRASSIDELPQLFNVLAGEMSLVGPRPHAVAHDDEYSKSVNNYAFRQHVKPGITGWAQTQGCRGETADLTSMKRRIQLDLWYINNWSFWLDLRIVLKTCISVISPTNAY